MKINIVIFGCALAMNALGVVASENLIKNGTFEDGSYGYKFQTTKGEVPDALTWMDTGGNPGACLKVTIPKEAAGAMRCHVAGVSYEFPTVPVGKTLKIRFSAKGLKGSDILMVCRAYGGNLSTFVLEPKWQTYEIEWPLQLVTGGILFNLVEKEVLPGREEQYGLPFIVEGEFLLDNVEVTVK